MTHECKYPEDAKSKPRVTNYSFDASKMNSKDIDEKIIELMQSGRDIYVLNDDILREAKPEEEDVQPALQEHGLQMLRRERT